MNATQIETTISQLIADGMPARLVTTGWTTPNRLMDFPWEDLDVLLDEHEPISAKWDDSSQRLAVTFLDGLPNQPLEPITKSFAPIVA